ncbi:MAG: translation elongation factor Ts [Albidovulum sp.]|nr:translation elongation factor Ts [Albidovulum sp.]
MAVTAAMVKQLREMTGAGIMDAKKALVENDGDTEAAVDWLRKKGLATAAKKAGRIAAEGLVGIRIDGSAGVVVEVNSETDFVAKNSEFQSLVSDILKLAIESPDLETLLASDIGGRTVKDAVTEKVATIGENLSLRRMRKVVGGGVVGYVHNSPSKNLGKIGALVAYNGGDGHAARQIALHVAASRPLSLSENDLPADAIEREKNVLAEQARESGKPEAVIEKMIAGRLRKYFEEVTLLNQKYVFDQDQNIRSFAENAGIEIVDFVRFEVGEGIEKNG